MMSPTCNGPILVAVDASPAPLAALDWAIKHATETGQALRIITAFEPRNGPSTDTARSYLDELEHAELLATERVQAALRTVHGLDDLAYDHIVALGPIDKVLQEHSFEASLAVVGTRARTTWFTRLFQRSVTNQITGSLACPVVSVTEPVHNQTTREVAVA